MRRKMYKSPSGKKFTLLMLVFAAFSGITFSQTTYTFSYTGNTQTINLLPGSYSIQCWGANGGNAANSGSATVSQGGKGGFSTGVFTNSATAVFNVYVGGRGSDASGVNVGSGGGGMSDIAPASNSTLIIIAAGGGGGSTSGSTSSEISVGGNGGGLVGQTAQDNSGVTGGSAATGGSQTSGGSATAGSYGVGSPGGYGYGGGAANGGTAGVIHSAGGGGGNGGNGGWNGGGGGCTLTGINDNSAGGGAGYYGGGGGRGDGGAGVGGSSYIGGVSSATTIMFGQSGFVTNPDVVGNGRILITELCSISIYASGSNSLNAMLCSGQSLTLTTNATSNYTWSTGQTTSSIVVAPGTNTVYTLAATSSLNCTANASMSVTVSSGLPVLSISNPSNNICLGQTATLTASGALTYTWSNPAVVNGQTFAPVSTTQYTVTGSNGCGNATAVTGITVAALSVTVASSPTIVCEGYTATLTANSSVSGYTWEPGTLTSSLVVISPTANTIYTVLASDGICAGTATLLVTTKTTPTVTATASSSMICEGDQVVLTASGASTYTWNPGNLSGNSVTVSPSSSTLYVVAGTNSVNCEASTNQVIIVNPSPTLVVNASKPVSCAGDEVVLTASGANNYAWSGGPSTPMYSVYPTATTVYTVMGTDSGNPCTDTETISVMVVVPNVSATSDTAVCEGKSVQLIASGATSYTWNGIATGTLTVSPSATTVYTLTALTNSGSAICPSTLTVMITVNMTPTISVAATKSVICKGQTNTLTASGAATYTWQGSLGTGTSVTVKPTATSIFTLSGTSAEGCEGESQVTVLVNSCNGVEEYNSGLLFKVYPNPNNGNFIVSSESAQTVYIVNTLGQIARTLELNNETSLHVEVSGLAKGIYYLRSSGGPNNSSHTKLVVN